ncbi:MAG: hypothetical protein DI528_12860 [Shinella sp.]|nr:MAG: hypothetical protein DI528_12860 [Shinella sp.]
MPVIKLSAFIGEQPLILPHLLPETAATSAWNVRMDDGGLTPINKSVLDGGIAVPGAQSLYRHGEDWLSWTGNVHAVPGPVSADRLYLTGDGAPKMRVDGVEYPLALAAPTAAPTVTVTGTGTGDTVSRTYVWTWVTDFGEESAPSPTSTIIDWKPGQAVTLSGFSAAPAGRNITKQRIYRSQTGSSGTYLYFIAERAATAANFADTVAVDGFNEALPSAGWTPPPDNLSGLISMPNGMMAAFAGRDVYFCEPWRPHAWPDRYSMTCDSDVVGLASIGSILVVMTKAHPYLMSGSTPDTMQSQKLEAKLPCINARGIVDLGFAVCYPSNLGLVVVRGDGSIDIVTRQMFNAQSWLALNPKTALGAAHNDLYVMFYETAAPDGGIVRGALIINVQGTPFLSRSSEYAEAVYFSDEDTALYFVPAGDTKIYRFDAPTGASEIYSWRSKEFLLSQPVTFGAVLVDGARGASSADAANRQAEAEAVAASNEQIIAGDMLNAAFNEHVFNQYPVGGDALAEIPEYDRVTVGIYADGVLVRSINTLGKIERLPAGRKARKWEIAISGNQSVGQLLMASTVDEIRSQG